MQTKYLCVYIHIWIKGEVGAPLNRFKPSSEIFYWPFQGGTSFVDLLCFCSVLCLLCLCILGRVWYLIVSIPDLCTLTYFENHFGRFKSGNFTQVLLYMYLNRGIHTSDNFIWAITSLMNFIWTDDECKTLFIIWLLNAILLPSKFVYFNEKCIVVTEPAWHYLFPPK